MISTRLTAFVGKSVDGRSERDNVNSAHPATNIYMRCLQFGFWHLHFLLSHSWSYSRSHQATLHVIVRKSGKLKVFLFILWIFYESFGLTAQTNSLIDAVIVLLTWHIKKEDKYSCKCCSRWLCLELFSTLKTAEQTEEKHTESARSRLEEFLLWASFFKRPRHTHFGPAPLTVKAHLSPLPGPLIPTGLLLSDLANACKSSGTHSPHPGGFRALTHPDCILALKKTQERR